MQAFFDTPPAASASEMIVCSARMVFSAGPPPLKITALPALCGLWLGLENSRRRCLVANRATLPQKWPPPPRNVADSCEMTATTKQTELSISRGRVVRVEGHNAKDAFGGSGEGNLGSVKVNRKSEIGRIVFSRELWKDREACDPPDRVSEKHCRLSAQHLRGSGGL